MQILAGTFRGRKLLPPPKGAQTRPMTSSVKKSLLEVLTPWLSGSTVADLYCGTGTMGLEAISRGAARCAFAEKDPRLIERLERNCRELGVKDRCEIWPGDLRRGLPRRLESLGRLDLAFVDPPYAHVRRWSWEQVAGEIFAPLSASLAEDGVVALRVPAKIDVPEELGGLRNLRERDYHDMRVAILGGPKLAEEDAHTPA